jgi:hypothetical protein
MSLLPKCIEKFQKFLNFWLLVPNFGVRFEVANGEVFQLHVGLMFLDTSFVHAHNFTLTFHITPLAEHAVSNEPATGLIVP